MIMLHFVRLPWQTEERDSFADLEQAKSHAVNLLRRGQGAVGGLWELWAASS